MNLRKNKMANWNNKEKHLKHLKKIGFKIGNKYGELTKKDYSKLKGKLCQKCNLYKDISEWYLSKKRKQPSTYCKKCEDARCLVYYKKTLKKRRKYRREKQLKRNFGIDLIEYNSLLKKQKCKCAICNISLKQYRLKSRYKHFSVDHCHSTNKIRGLLCSVCNTQLGYYEKYKKQFNEYIL
jgi:hypothetical protein